MYRTKGNQTYSLSIQLHARGNLFFDGVAPDSLDQDAIRECVSGGMRDADNLPHSRNDKSRQGTFRDLNLP